MNQSKDRDNNTTKRKKIDEKQAIIDKKCYRNQGGYTLLAEM